MVTLQIKNKIDQTRKLHSSYHLLFNSIGFTCIAAGKNKKTEEQILCATSVRESPRELPNFFKFLLCKNCIAN